MAPVINKIQATVIGAKYKLLGKAIRIFVTFNLFMFSLIFFRVAKLRDALSMIKSIFVVRNGWIFASEDIFRLGLEWKEWMLLWGCIALLFVVELYYEDSSYDISRINYERKVKNIDLSRTNDIYQYLDMLQDENYCVFVFGPKEFGKYIDSDIEQKLQSLGLKSMLAGVQNGMHYCAVIDSDGIVEDLSEGNANLTGSIRGGYTLYSFIIDKSTLAEKTHTYSLKIDGQECGNKLNGLNFVVYDKDMKMVVDKVIFDTSLEDKPASRY